jgi:UDP-4-amino-4,6-dideoxy-N-acetyl-beta-L-altrosamine transaminase
LHKPIPYGRQNISPADVQAVVDVLRSDWLTQGPAIGRFEQAVAAYCGVGHAVATCNATAALHLACLALEVGPGDWLWTSPNTFVASANCGLYCGARVDFVDIDPKTYNISVPALASKLEHAKREGKLPKVVVPVDFSGQSCEMRAIAELASQYGFRVIEDASHAVGGDYLGSKVGNGRYADVTIFSFHPVKIITTGEGGLVLTNDPELHDRIAMLRSHGITRNPELMEWESEGPWYYQQVALGFNYRVTDLQAALGLSQLARVDEFVRRRRQLAARYARLLSDLPVVTPWQHPDTCSAWHLYVIQLASECGCSRREVVEKLRVANVLVNVHYIPVHLQPYYRHMGFQPGMYPIAEKYYGAAISLPMYYDLTDEEQDYVVDQLRCAVASLVSR